MKKVIFYAILVLATLVMFWQQATIKNLSAYMATTETLLNRIEQDNPVYVLDVLTESDEYQNYCESLDRL